jgi:phospholipid/cholesterol/gamma-HCH transport system permease protein
MPGEVARRPGKAYVRRCRKGATTGLWTTWQGSGPLAAMRDSLYRFFEQLGELGLLTRDFIRYLFRRPFEARLLIEQLDSIGWRSLNVVNLTAIFTGMVLALQMGGFLSRFGAKIYVSRIMGISLLREMGPVLTALMIGARVGSGIAAELGSMTVTEQVDAMRALATSPVKKLVVPRVLATIVILPVLTMIADAVGLFGGLLISVTQLGVSAEFFYTSLIRNVSVSDLVSGLSKAFFFGYLISIIACHKGLGARGGADGVGRATTSAVVAASISILVTDFFLTKLFLSL